MVVFLESFKSWCGLPSVHRTINKTHIIIAKPTRVFTKDYYCNKIGGYNMVA
jgi:hypothetical protein